MNTEYMKIIEKGFTLQSRCNRGGYNRLYLIKDKQRIAYTHYRDNRSGKDDIESFENAKELTHKDVAMWELNRKIEELGL